MGCITVWKRYRMFISQCEGDTRWQAGVKSAHDHAETIVNLFALQYHLYTVSLFHTCPSARGRRDAVVSMLAMHKSTDMLQCTGLVQVRTMQGTRST